MKIHQIPIPQDSLVARYLPADYSDAFECLCPLPESVTADDVQIALWTRSPKWLDALMRLRNWLVRPFGLRTGGSEAFQKEILKGVTDRSDTETVIAEDDKHLKFYCSVILVPAGGGLSRITVCTVVRFHNRLGQAYFTVIRPFHNMIVPRMLKGTVRRLVGGR